MPGPAGGAYSVPPDHLVGLKERERKDKGGERRRRKGRGGEGNRREEEERRRREQGRMGRGEGGMRPILCPDLGGIEAPEF